ncbi:MAG: hypothetical protein M3Y48_23705, partial [Actinomycetota bacterium]|nr:hypothetical protein [Actinomycetota bacterium]
MLRLLAALGDNDGWVLMLSSRTLPSGSTSRSVHPEITADGTASCTGAALAWLRTLRRRPG